VRSKRDGLPIAATNDQGISDSVSLHLSHINISGGGQLNLNLKSNKRLASSNSIHKKKSCINLVRTLGGISKVVKFAWRMKQVVGWLVWGKRSRGSLQKLLPNSDPHSFLLTIYIYFNYIIHGLTRYNLQINLLLKVSKNGSLHSKYKSPMSNAPTSWLEFSHERAL
jgi:hypothetical protein